MQPQLVFGSISSIAHNLAPLHFPHGPVCPIESHSRRGLVTRQRGEAEVGLHDGHLGEEVLGILGLDAGVHNHVVTYEQELAIKLNVACLCKAVRPLTREPVDRRGNLVLVAGLQRVDHAQDLGGVAAGAGGVGEDQADALLGVDDEDAADGESNALLVHVGGVLVVDPVE